MVPCMKPYLLGDTALALRSAAVPGLVKEHQILFRTATRAAFLGLWLVL
jgi:hypothetical protein